MMASSEGEVKSSTKEHASGKESLDEQIQHVFALMVSCSRGQVANDDVENAVSKILATSAPAKQESEIQQDTDDYDNLEEAPVPKKASSPTKWPPATIESIRQDDDDDDESDTLDNIPLGKLGAKMMVTFGDGPKPQPEAVSAALLGARKCLHVAIKDARALRRHEKDEYTRARKVVLMGKKHTRGGRPTAEETSQESAGSGMLYRAMKGYDNLTYDPKCGFDIEQLKQLFPEEMRAYDRFNEMHEAYEKSREEPEASTTEKGREQIPESDKTPITDSDVPVAAGHLEERAAQFDARTEQMKDDWYMQFAECRLGSFLPKRGRGKSEEERQWDANRKQGRGRPKMSTGSWDSMSAPYVRFLHWIGFDPRSALPPPNEETTEALAFLGYDFFGRIVERAIYLRNIANKKGDKNLLLELQEGEQLGAADIEKAINDSTIRPVPLYSGIDNESSKLPVAAQLYFGPGFEARLEIELDELASAGNKRKRLTPEEQEIRQREDELFSKLADAPIVLDGFAQVLGEEAATKDARDESITDDDR